MHKAVVTDVTELKTNKLVDNGALIHPILESRMVGNLVCKLVTYISMAARQPVYSPPEPTWHFPTPIV